MTTQGKSEAPPHSAASLPDPRIDRSLAFLLAMIATGLEVEIRRLVDELPPGSDAADSEGEALLEARWEAVGGLLVDHAQPLRDGLRELAGCEPIAPGAEEPMLCPTAAPSWYALEARGLRETFLLAVPSAADRERLKRWAAAQFERLLERHGFAADHACLLGALLEAAGRDLAFLSSLLQSAAEEELEGSEEPATGKRQLARVRRATRSLDGLSGRFEVLAAAFEAEASERPSTVLESKA